MKKTIALSLILMLLSAGCKSTTFSASRTSKTTAFLNFDSFELTIDEERSDGITFNDEFNDFKLTVNDETSDGVTITMKGTPPKTLTYSLAKGTKNFVSIDSIKNTCIYKDKVYQLESVKAIHITDDKIILNSRI